VKLWLAYAAVATPITLAGIGVAILVSPSHRDALAFAGVSSLVVQLVAFALLVVARKQPTLLLAAWGGGMLLRMIAVLAVGLWLTGGGPFPAQPSLLAMVAVLTGLALLEPLALRRTHESTEHVG